MKKLKNLSEIRNYFFRNQIPTYFISATNFNLIGMDDWIQNFKYVSLIDSFDKKHPNLVTPKSRGNTVFQTIEEINNYLLQHKDIIDEIQKDKVKTKRKKKRSNALFLFFNSTTEKLCKELGLKLCFPSSKLRDQLDNKVVTTEIGNEAGVPSVPNALSHVRSYSHLMDIANKHKLGPSLVIQLPYGDSGKTTYFVESAADYQKVAQQIQEQPRVKIMKKIQCFGTAIEACTTRNGTLVGPLMTELIGFKSLTPYKGGWCGNEMIQGAFSKETQKMARTYTENIGNLLYKKGYKGYFEIDYLIDELTGQLYLGEMNPRLTGASCMTNLGSYSHSDAPLFLFHLLEHQNVDFDINVAELNDRWMESSGLDDWSQIVIKDTHPGLKYLEGAPASGIWEINDDGTMTFIQADTQRKHVCDQNRAFYLRIAQAGDYVEKGSDLGILLTRGKVMTSQRGLTKQASKWVKAVKKAYIARPIKNVHPTKKINESRIASYKVF